MSRSHLGHPLVLCALAACATAGGVALWTLGRALSVRPMPEPFVSEARRSQGSTDRPVATPSASLAAAVEGDPFHPERRRPAERFRLPGEAGPSDTLAAADGAASLRLLGTAVLAEGRGFAMYQAGAETPRLVRVGETVGELTLKRVEQGRAVFRTRAGRAVELRVPKAGS
jgi:hypothetical protein